MTFRTFGVEHYELEENMVQYKKRESPKLYNKQELPCGTFLMGHEKAYGKSINLDIRQET